MHRSVKSLIRSFSNLSFIWRRQEQQVAASPTLSRRLKLNEESRGRSGWGNTFGDGDGFIAQRGLDCGSDHNGVPRSLTTVEVAPSGGAPRWRAANRHGSSGSHTGESSRRESEQGNKRERQVRVVTEREEAELEQREGNGEMPQHAVYDGGKERAGGRWN